MDYSLAEVRAFNAAIQCGNFTRAAQQLSVSQPAITAQIRKLESRFETPLLERFSRGLKPTELGKRLYQITCQYSDLQGAIEALANPQTPPGKMTLRVATASPLVFMPLIAQFNQRFPDVTLKITSVTTLHCKKMLLNREVDIGLFPSGELEPGFSRLAYSSHRLMAILKAGHPYATQKNLSVLQLRDEPLIFYKPEACTQQLLNDLFRRANMKANANVTVDGRLDMCEAVAYGLGIGFALAQDVRPDERLRTVTVTEASENVLEHVVWQKNRSALPGVRDFIQLTLEQRSETALS
ncbi:LysR family transcriptional regulator [Neptunomonas antarctica]|uniref:DNA-binding transcriptional regulator, LysR family n=1 Tax=Neptunomonas antarctica TaxID=619304 RepID=A0A1N7NUJ6_9GAMM|nr:LysR family transcriptional regulator [Neptunomonas antarctica]SIT01977.1 DNA-binding transcriptional regulator, LysR family [Neptunomonas antarctica]